MLKKILSWFGSANERSNKSEVIITQKQNMSYSVDKTGFPSHDKKLSRNQWEKGYINDATYYKTTISNFKLFDIINLKKMYPECTEDQLK